MKPTLAKGYSQIVETLFPQQSDDEDIVEVEDAPNPPGVEKGLKRFCHQGENQGGEAETKRKDEVLVENPPPPEAKKASEASIDRDVEVRVL